MTYEDVVWDVREIVKAIEDDSDLEDLWIIHKINSWRETLLEQEFKRSREVNPDWLQRTGMLPVEKTSAADDPKITNNSVTLGKMIIPPVAKLPDDMGVYQISGASAIQTFEPATFQKLMLLAQYGQVEENGFGYYTRIGTTIYLLPIILRASAILILKDPTDLNKDENGEFNWKDEYPLDTPTLQRAIISFLTTEMAIYAGSIADVLNNSADDLRIMPGANVPTPQA